MSRWAAAVLALVTITAVLAPTTASAQNADRATILVTDLGGDEIVVAGEAVNLTVVIRNDSDTVLGGGQTLSLAATGPLVASQAFGPLPASIQPGQSSAPIPMTLTFAPGELEVQPTFFTLTLRSNSELGTFIEGVDTFGLSVTTRPQFELSIADATVINGEQTDVALRIFNTRSTEARFDIGEPGTAWALVPATTGGVTVVATPVLPASIPANSVATVDIPVVATADGTLAVTLQLTVNGQVAATFPSNAADIDAVFAPRWSVAVSDAQVTVGGEAAVTVQVTNLSDTPQSLAPVGATSFRLVASRSDASAISIVAQPPVPTTTFAPDETKTTQVRVQGLAQGSSGLTVALERLDPPVVTPLASDTATVTVGPRPDGLSLGLQLDDDGGPTPTVVVTISNNTTSPITGTVTLTGLVDPVLPAGCSGGATVSCTITVPGQAPELGTVFLFITTTKGPAPVTVIATLTDPPGEQESVVVPAIAESGLSLGWRNVAVNGDGTTTATLAVGRLGDDPIGSFNAIVDLGGGPLPLSTECEIVVPPDGNIDPTARCDGSIGSGPSSFRFFDFTFQADPDRTYSVVARAAVGADVFVSPPLQVVARPVARQATVTLLDIDRSPVLVPGATYDLVATVLNQGPGALVAGPGFGQAQVRFEVSGNGFGTVASLGDLDGTIQEQQSVLARGQITVPTEAAGQVQLRAVLLASAPGITNVFDEDTRIKYVLGNGFGDDSVAVELEAPTLDPDQPTVEVHTPVPFQVTVTNTRTTPVPAGAVVVVGAPGAEDRRVELGQIDPGQATVVPVVLTPHQSTYVSCAELSQQLAGLGPLALADLLSQLPGSPGTVTEAIDYFCEQSGGQGINPLLVTAQVFEGDVRVGSDDLLLGVWGNRGQIDDLTGIVRDFSFGQASPDRAGYPHCVIVAEPGRDPGAAGEACFASFDQAERLANQWGFVYAILYDSPGGASSLRIVGQSFGCQSLTVDLPGIYQNWTEAIENGCGVVTATADGSSESVRRGFTVLSAPVAGQVDSVAFHTVAASQIDPADLLGEHGYGFTEADPVHVATGNLVERSIDLTFGPQIKGMELSRHYNSANVEQYVIDERGPASVDLLGRGWRLSHQITAVVEPSGVVAITQGDGRLVRFEPDPSVANRYLRPDDFDGRLVVSPDGTFVVEKYDGTRWLFDDDGRVATMTFADGQSVDLTFLADHRIAAITSSTGLGYRLAYGDDDLLTRIEAVDGSTVDRAVRFDHTAGFLSAATAANGDVVRYRTDDQGRITAIDQVDDAAGTTVRLIENVYDAAGRVTLQTNGAGETADFVYDAVARRTVVLITAADDDGRDRQDIHVYSHDDRGYTLDITDPTGELISIDRQPGGEPGRILDRRANAEGGAEELASVYEYDAAGNVVVETVPGLGTWRYSYFYTVDTSTEADPPTVPPGGASQVRLRSVEAPWGGTTTYSYAGSDNIPTTITAPAGDVTTNTVVDGLMTRTEDADGVVIDYRYDSRRRLVTQTLRPGDGSALVTRYAYDGAGRVSSVTDPLGQVQSFDFDDSGQLTAITDRTGARVEWRYDGTGRLAEFRDARYPQDPLGATTTMDYDFASGSGLPSAATDQRGNQTSFTFNGFSQLSAVERPSTGPDPARWTIDNQRLGRPGATAEPAVGAAAPRRNDYGYDAEGNLAVITRTDGSTVEVVEFDAADRPVRLVDPNGNVTTRSFDQFGRLTTERRAVGTPDEIAMAYTYDEANRLETITGPRPDQVTRYRYTPAGRLDSITDPRGNTVVYGYDGAGRVSTVTRPGDRVYTYIYDADSRITEIRSPEGQRLRTDYDEEGRVVRSTSPAGVVTDYTYDGNGALTSSSSGTDGPTVFEVDSLVLNAAVDPNGGTAAVDYDGRYNPTGWTDQRGNSWTSAFDVTDRLTRVEDPLGRISEFGYDTVGRLGAVDDPSGRSAELLYDDGDRLITTRFADGSAQGLAYDGLDRTVSVSTCPAIAAGERCHPLVAGAITTAFAYDEAGNVVSVTDGLGTAQEREVTYRWDPSGNRIGMTYPAADGQPGATVDYRYDELSRLIELTYRPDDGSPAETVGYRYDDDSRLRSVAYPDGSTRTYGYTGEQITSFSDGRRSWTIGYDAEGRIDRVRGHDEWNFRYDDGGQLTRAKRSGSRWTYDHDPAGNIERLADGRSGIELDYDHDAANQLAEATAGSRTVSFQHDEAGRLTLADEPGGRQTSYGYDVRGRLETVTVTEPAVASLDGALVHLRNASTNLFVDADGNAWGSIDQDVTPRHDDRWRLERTADGSFEIRNDATGGYLTSRSYHGHHSVSQEARPGPNGRWWIDVEPDGAFTLTNVANGRYLAATRAYDGARLTTVADRQGDATRWHIGFADPTADGRLASLDGARVAVLNRHTDRFLDGQPTNPDWHPDRNVDQSGGIQVDGVWELRQLASGAWTVRNVANDDYLRAEGSQHHDNVVTVARPGGDVTEAELWELTRRGDGWFELRNVARQRYLDGDGRRSGYNVDTRRYGGGDDTDWSIIVLDDIEVEPTSETWSRTYSPDGLLATVTRAGDDGTTDTWNLLWDRTGDPVRPLRWTGPRPIDLIHGIGPALVNTGGAVETIRTGILGDVIGSSASIDRWYDPYGLPRGEGDWYQDRSSDRALGLGYRGELHIGPTIHLRMRDLAPHLGRFLTPDVLPAPTGAATTSRYAYAANDPINKVDPTGAVAEDADLALFLQVHSRFTDATDGQFWDHPDAERLFRQAVGDSNGQFPEFLAAVHARWAANTALGTDPDSANKYHQIVFDYRDQLFLPGADRYVGCVSVKRHGIDCDPADQLAAGQALLDAGGTLGASRRGRDGTPGTGGRCSSFVPGTRVLLADGSTRAIDEIEIGDRVWAADPETGRTGPRSVVGLVSSSGPKHLVELEVEGGGEVVATDLHPVWVDSQGRWLEAEDVRPGDLLLDERGVTVAVDDVDHVRVADQRVHNLTIADLHTYFVVAGDRPVLVHNVGDDACPYVLFNREHRSSQPQPKGVGPNGGRLQSHHGLQSAWARENLAEYGYNPASAPTITLETGAGLPHSIITGRQQARRDARSAAGLGRWSSTLNEELGFIVEDLRAVGFSDPVIADVLAQQYAMLDTLGVTYTRPQGF